MKIEQLEAVLEMAVKAGAIRSYSREKSDDAAHFCRNFYIVGNLNDHYTIEWYTNMMTFAFLIVIRATTLHLDSFTKATNQSPTSVRSMSIEG